MRPSPRPSLRRVVLVSALALALGCTKRERTEVWSGPGADEAAEKGLLPGHVHLFELVQWGAPTGGIVAGKRAERDALRLAVAKRRVELLDAKIERGVLEEREMKLIRVQYTRENWERQNQKVKRPPNGKVEPSTMMAPQQPGRPAHEVPAVIVEQYQEQMPKEVVRTPDEAAAFWEKQLGEAREALARAQEADEKAKAAAEEDAGSTAPPVEKTRVTFAVLRAPQRAPQVDPPRDPRGWVCGTCESGAKQHRSFVLHGTGSLSPEPPALRDRAALEKGVDLTERVLVQGLDSAESRWVDPKDGRVVLRLVGHCPARVFQAKEEIKVNPGYVISIPQSIGFAEWFELPLPACAGEQALRTRVTDLLAGAAAAEAPAIDDDLRRLAGELSGLDYHLKRIKEKAR